MSQGLDIPGQMYSLGVSVRDHDGQLTSNQGRVDNMVLADCWVISLHDAFLGFFDGSVSIIPNN